VRTTNLPLQERVLCDCPKAFLSILLIIYKPSKAQATPLPAFSARKLPNKKSRTPKRFFQPIQDSDRQGDWNPRVFLEGKVIPASSQLNPNRDKIFQFSGQSLLNPNFGQANFAQQFRFATQDYLTPDLNSSQNRSIRHFLTCYIFGAFPTFQRRMYSVFLVHRQISGALI